MKKIDKDQRNNFVKGIKVFLVRKKNKSDYMVFGHERYKNLSEDVENILDDYRKRSAK